MSLRAAGEPNDHRSKASVPIMLLVFWFMVALVFYTYAGYPALIWCIGRIRRRYRSLPLSPPAGLSVCVVVATYNEARVIGEKLDSLLGQTYARALTDIMVVDDGSDDRTRAVVKAYEAQGVRLTALPRGGKAAALNRALQDCKADIVAFTDADTLWLPDTLHHLLAPFDNPRIGGVAGHVIMAKADTQGLGDRVYRAYETFIRCAEMRAGNCASADGGLFAIRRHLADCVPPGVTDDFYLSTGVVAKGASLVYQSQAIVLEKSIAKPSGQFWRRVRITVRGMESLYRRRALLNPFCHGRFAITLFSHKLLRRIAPAFLLLLFPANALLLAHGIVYQTLFAIQLFSYAIAMVGFFDRAKHLPQFFRVASYIMLGNAGTFVGVFNFLIGVRYAQWIPQKNEYDSVGLRRRDG